MKRGGAMRDPQVWSSTTADNMPVVVLKDGVFYAGAVEVHKHGEFEKKIEAGEHPQALLGPACPCVPLEDVTRVVANNIGDLVIESQGRQALRQPMHKAGVDI